MAAGDVVSIDHGFLSVHQFETALVECLNLVCSRGLGLTDVVCQLECSDSAQVQVIKMESEQKSSYLPALLTQSSRSPSTVWQDSRAS